MNPNPIPTQIYTIPTPNPIPLHMNPNPESNPDSDSDSSFDSDSGFGIAPGLIITGFFFIFPARSWDHRKYIFLCACLTRILTFHELWFSLDCTIEWLTHYHLWELVCIYTSWLHRQQYFQLHTYTTEWFFSNIHNIYSLHCPTFFYLNDNLSLSVSHAFCSTSLNFSLVFLPFRLLLTLCSYH